MAFLKVKKLNYISVKKIKFLGYDLKFLVKFFIYLLIIFSSLNDTIIYLYTGSFNHLNNLFRYQKNYIYFNKITELWVMFGSFEFKCYKKKLFYFIKLFYVNRFTLLSIKRWKFRRFVPSFFIKNFKVFYKERFLFGFHKFIIFDKNLWNFENFFKCNFYVPFKKIYKEFFIYSQYSVYRKLYQLYINFNFFIINIISIIKFDKFCSLIKFTNWNSFFFTLCSFYFKSFNYIFTYFKFSIIYFNKFNKFTNLLNLKGYCYNKAFLFFVYYNIIIYLYIFFLILYWFNKLNSLLIVNNNKLFLYTVDNNVLFSFYRSTRFYIFSRRFIPNLFVKIKLYRLKKVKNFFWFKYLDLNSTYIAFKRIKVSNIY